MHYFSRGTCTAVLSAEIHTARLGMLVYKESSPHALHQLATVLMHWQLRLHLQLHPQWGSGVHAAARQRLLIVTPDLLH